MRSVRRLTNALLAATVLIAFAAAADSFRYQDYRPDTIERALTDNPHDSRLTERYNAGNFKYRVLVTSTGELRVLPAETREFIARWGAALGHRSATDLFEQELLVKEGDLSYWLPIQKQLISALGKEVGSDAPVYLYIMHAGSIRSRQIFLINEFDELKSQH